MSSRIRGYPWTVIVQRVDAQELKVVLDRGRGMVTRRFAAGTTTRDHIIVWVCRNVVSSSQPMLLVVALLIIHHQLPFIPLRTLTRLPQRTTEVTKFGLATASRVEAAYVELDHVRTAWAAGPARGAAEL